MSLGFGKAATVMTVATMLAVAGCAKGAERDGGRSNSADGPAGRGFSASPATGRRGSASYVGMEYSRPPAGVRSIGGATLAGPGGTLGDYAFNHVTTPRGEMIWLDSVAGTERVVLAQLQLPPLARDERLFIGSCDINGQLDPRAVAIIIDELDATRYTKVRQVWRADPQMARFDVLPVAGVVCEDPGT